MNTMEIVKDALRYPFSDLKKILILGILVVITDIVYISRVLGAKNIGLIVFLIGIAFIIGFLVNGYMYRIIKSSLECKVELPEFNDWVNMGAEGAKIYIVYIVYLIPAILLILHLVLSSYGNLVLILKEVGLNLFDYLIPSLTSIIWTGILNFIMLSISLFTIATLGVLDVLIGIPYIILVTPIILVAIANMAYYEGELKSAFKLSEIIEEISLIGWWNLIKWYIVTGIIFLILTVIVQFIYYIFSFSSILAEIISSLILFSYIYIYLARSVALFYIPDKEDSNTIEEESTNHRHVY